MLKHMRHNPQITSTESLDADECWELLRRVSVARLAVWVQDHPDIFPVNYTVDHGSLVFRTGAGTKLAAALGETPVAIEADGVDATTGVAWSVVAKGPAAPLRSPDEVVDSFSLMLFPWESGPKDAFVRISPTSITGRRFTIASPKEWWNVQARTRRAAEE